jgi:lipopolysaccharide transport system permease protein
MNFVRKLFDRSDTTPVYYITPPRLADLWTTAASLFAYMTLLYVFIVRNLSFRYRQSLLGIAWVVLQPLATTLVIFFMFGIIGAKTSGKLPSGIFLFVGVMSWQFFMRATQDGTMSLRNNANILTHVYFPRIILPLASVAVGWVELAIMLALAVLICVLQGVGISPRIVMLPLFFLALSLAALAISLWLAPVNALVRDITFILPFALQFGMFASPVLYSGELVPDRWRTLFYLNPVSTMFDAVRWSIFANAPAPDWMFFAINLATVLVLLVTGLLVFQKLESSVVDRI